MTTPHTHPGTCNNPDPLDRETVDYVANSLMHEDMEAGIDVSWPKYGDLYRSYARTCIAAMGRRGLLLCSARTQLTSSAAQPIHRSEE